MPEYRTKVLLEVVDVHDADGHAVRQIVAVPDRFYAYATPDQTVVFESRYPFTIRFDEGSPLSGKPEYRTEEEEEDRRAVYRLIQRARPDAARVKPYKYTVTMCVRNEPLTVDPDGVLDPDPSRR